MSVLEIVLYTIIGGATLWYVIKSIYDLKHPEKVKARKEKKKQKKLEKGRTENNETRNQDQDIYE